MDKKKWSSSLAVICVLGALTAVPAEAKHLVDYHNTHKFDIRLEQKIEKKVQVAAAPRPSLTPLAAPKPERETFVYKVNKGDTLFRIANAFDTSVEVIMYENQIADPHLLQIGKKLKISRNKSNIAVFLDGKESNVEKVLNATLTAYTAGFESTGKTPSHPAYGITSSGAKVKEGRTIAVDPKIIPIGSTVYIEDIGIRVAEDTGSAIKGAKIDVYMEDLEEAIEFGVQKNRKVYILKTPKSDNAIY